MPRVSPLLVALAALTATLEAAPTVAAINSSSPAASPAPLSALAGASKAQPPSQRFNNSETAAEPSFRRHVVPMMSRLGCSGRECHGSFQGRGGFQLSLFGYDFEKDHEQMSLSDNGDEGGVRVDLKDPANSLLPRQILMCCRADQRCVQLPREADTRYGFADSFFNRGNVWHSFCGSLANLERNFCEARHSRFYEYI
jgi:hypothetical protein